MNTGERVKVLRKDILGLTLDKFGDRLHVGKSAISDIERGRNNLSEQMPRRNWTIQHLSLSHNFVILDQ